MTKTYSDGSISTYCAWARATAEFYIDLYLNSDCVSEDDILESPDDPYPSGAGWVSPYDIVDNEEYPGDYDAPETYEYEAHDSINVSDYMDCFGTIPSGASYSATIYTDLPVNSNPNLLVNATGSPGHVFISMTKEINGITTTQVFGFYPQVGLFSLARVPVNSVIVDDELHSYDASLTMNGVSASAFSSLMQVMIMLSSQSYDLDDFNCTDYALASFNILRPTNPLDVPDWVVLRPALFPPGLPVRDNFGSTPNALYKLLKKMKDDNETEASNIQVGPRTAPAGAGPCN
mgnify:CR=1 FL=1